MDRTSATPGRKPLPPTEPVAEEINPAAVASASTALDVVGAMDAAAADSAEVYRFVGRIEAAQFAETVSGRVIAESYAALKLAIGKAGSVAVRMADGSRKRVSGVDEFCDLVMPVSARRCRQLASDVQLLGSLYEQAEAIGFRARDYQALKALPSDDQALVKKAIETEDREVVIDLLSELAGRNDALRKQAAEHDKVSAAKDKVIAKKDEKLNAIAEAEERRRSASVPEAERLQLDDLRAASVAAEQALAYLTKVVDEVMGNAASAAVDVAARQALDYLAQRFQDAAGERGPALNLQEPVDPAYMLQMTELVNAAEAAGKLRPVRGAGGGKRNGKGA